MTITPADSLGAIPLGPSPWEQATRRADAGEIVHLVDITGEHRYVVMTEAEFEALEDAAEDRWLAEVVAPKIHEARRARAAGERGIPLDELMTELDAADAR